MLLKSFIFCIASLGLAQALVQWNFWNSYGNGMTEYNSEILNSDGTVMSSGGFASFVYFKTLTAESILTANYDQILADMVLLNDVRSSNQSGGDAWPGYFNTGFTANGPNYENAIGKLSFVFIANNQTIADASEFTLLKPINAKNEASNVTYMADVPAGMIIEEFGLDNKEKIVTTGAEHYFVSIFGSQTGPLAGQEPEVGNYKMVSTRAVPEPGTATLGLIALTGLVLRRRRRA